MIGAECLVLLSDIDGLYTAPPNDDPDAQLIPHVERITPAIMAMAGGAGSELSRGGMKTKIDAARIATEGGCAMVISLGKRPHPLNAISAGETATWFDPVTNPNAAKKTWISGSLDVRGTVTVDAGAVRALRSGKSLLPAGVTAVTGRFARGDTVAILDPAGAEIGRGLEQAVVELLQGGVERQHHEGQVGVDNAEMHRPFGAEDRAGVRREAAPAQELFDQAVVGQQAQSSTAAEMDRSARAEFERWGPLVKRLGFTAES
jgi:glutamate 5-kinase